MSKITRSIFIVVILSENSINSFQVFNDGQLAAVKDNIKNAWLELLQKLSNFKESASNFTSPQFLGEQLQIIFRDESKWNNEQFYR